MSLTSWVPLHVHSQYSILDASASVHELCSFAAKWGMPALALTDHGNLFGAVEFYKACQTVGIKPIIGCLLFVAPVSHLEKRRVPGMKTAYHLILLAKDDEGYRNLCKLSSLGYLEGFYYNPRIDKELLRKYAGGLICLSGCLSGRVQYLIAQGEETQAREEAQWYLEVFGEDYYFELQRHPMTPYDIEHDGMRQEAWVYQKYENFIKTQEEVNRKLIEFSLAMGVPLVATNDSHYMLREDWRAHEILLNVQSGEPCEIWEKDSLGNNKAKIPNPKRNTYPSHEIYFKSPEQMKALFHDIPEAIDNTLKVAEKCTFEMNFKKTHYPVFWPPHLDRNTASVQERRNAVAAYLKQLCEEGISEKYTKESLETIKKLYPDKEPMQVVRDRLNFELEVIISKEFTDYLLIVYDFIYWAKTNDVPVGPGRGSGVGSIILYLIGITGIEPLRFHLFFERFINPERLSYPDIDVDICMESRARVIEYATQKYGKENVAQIITFGTMKAKMAVKDVGRALSVPLPKVNIIAKYIPEDLNMTVAKALEVDADLQKMYLEDQEAHRVIDIAQSLEGSIRNTGIHAAGVIICGEPIMNHIPIYLAKDAEMPASQFSMKPVESVGMLKVDVLGLKTLTCIKIAVGAVRLNHGVDIDWVNLPLDDIKTFALLNHGKTLGVFQLESSGMQELARQLHLDKFEEIIAVVSLYRPGPMDMIPSYIQRKHGREPIEYDHFWMEEILAETYGIMVYQEQVMQIASKLANFSLGEGDVLRRAMGKKDSDQMATQREKFLGGAKQNQIDQETATRIFDKMEKFASYGFNKSHAAAYGYLSYVTAFLKAHYPGEWMAALMSCDCDDISKVAKFIGECQVIGIAILPPDINVAREAFTATKQGIRFGLGGIKGIGGAVIEHVIKERENKGPYASLFDFIKRIDTKKVGRKAVDSFIQAGCFDFTEWSRDAMLQSLDAMYDIAVKTHQEQTFGIISLFSLMGDSEGDQAFSQAPKVINPTSKNMLLAKEKELLGFYLTGHPMDAFRSLLQRLSCVSLNDLKHIETTTVVRTAFIVEDVNVRMSARSQKKFAILIVSDGLEKCELPVWADLYEEKNALLKENQLLYAVIQKEVKDGEVSLSCRWIDDLTKSDDKMVGICDQAYDRAKLQLERFTHAKNPKRETVGRNMKQTARTMKPISNQVPLILVLDANRTRLSHVLEIKKIFRESSGDQGIQIQFFSHEKRVAVISIEAPWGIHSNDDLKQRLRNIEGVLSVS